MRRLSTSLIAPVRVIVISKPIGSVIWRGLDKEVKVSKSFASTHIWSDAPVSIIQGFKGNCLLLLLKTNEPSKLWKREVNLPAKVVEKTKFMLCVALSEIWLWDACLRFSL